MPATTKAATATSHRNDTNTGKSAQRRRLKLAAPPEPGADDTLSPRAIAAQETRAVRRYLELLEAPRTGRRSRAQLTERLDAVQSELTTEPNPLRRVHLIQERIDLDAQLATPEPDDDTVLAEFIEVAAKYSERKGITWTAWREVGVPAEVLRAAKIPRTRRPNGT